jgi:hypothetical protein
MLQTTLPGWRGLVAVAVAAAFMVLLAALVDCWGSHLSVREKVFWTFVIVLFPVLGAGLYVLYGAARAAAQPRGGGAA